MWIHSTIANLAIANGVVLTRWTQVHTILKPKDRGTPKIHRLRPLNLYEADINLVLWVVLAQRLLQQAERSNRLADETWGTRKRRATGDLGLKKLLTYEMSALTRTTLGQIDLNAKSCYDRMTREIVAQACYSFRTPVYFCMWMYHLLRQQQHYVILPSGKSGKPYGHQPHQPHHGIGQGSTAAPVVWLLISSLMFQSMRRWAHGVSWESPDKKMQTHQVADVYVDDATLWVNNIHSPSQLVKQMELDLNRYKDMLRWTGGALTLHKCFFNILQWEFRPDGTALLKEGNHKIEIQRPEDKRKLSEIKEEVSRRGQLTALQQHQVLEMIREEFHCTEKDSLLRLWNISVDSVNIRQKWNRQIQQSLGFHTTPQGSTEESERRFSQATKQYGLGIVSSRLLPPEVKLAHQTLHLPSQTYQFQGAQFSRSFLIEETNKMMTKILPRLNLSRNHPEALRHAPKNRGGLALPHFYVVQGTTMPKIIFRHLRLNTTVGRYLLIHLKWTQLVLGLQTGILTDTSTLLDYLPHNWWLHMHTFLHHIQGNLQLEEEYVIPPNQQEDYSVMETLLEYKRSKKELQCINACRMYLQVTYVSDITSNHRSLSQSEQSATEILNGSRSKLVWLIQNKPNKQSWRVWKQALRKLCKEDGTSLRKLLTNRWSPRREWTQEWTFEYSTEHDHIVDMITGTVYGLNRRERNYAWYKQSQQTDRNSDRRIPILPVRVGDRLKVHRSQMGYPGRQVVEKSTGVKPTHRWAVSDGSVRHGSGTFRWVTASGRKIQDTNMGKVEGVTGNMTSFRAEAQGITDLIHTAAVDNKTQMFQDNLSVIEKTNQRYPLHPMQPEWELLEPTRKQVQNRQLQISHVRGHQDIDDPSTPWEAHLNHKADILAGEAHQQTD